MENIWKVILGIFISVMIVFSGLGILKANNDSASAEHYLYAVGIEISASNFAREVCAEKVAEAKGRDYELTVEFVDVGEGKSAHTAYAILTMNYPYEISLLNLHTTHTKQLVVY